MTELRRLKDHVDLKLSDEFLRTDNPRPFTLAEQSHTEVVRSDFEIGAIDDFIALPGEMDTIYANAGVGSPDGLSSGSADKMNHVLSVNILGVTNTVMPFLPHLKEIRKGKIAIISSVASFRGLAHHAAYSGSKAAVRNMSALCVLV